MDSLLLFLLIVFSTGWTTLALSSNPQACYFTNFECYAVGGLYAACNLTQQRCYCLDTFEGNASQVSPCSCKAPGMPYFPASLGTSNVGSPVCINLSELQDLQARNKIAQNQIAAVSTFLSFTLPPYPVQILATQGLPLRSILSPNVKSRISPAGTFNGYQGVIEYFYGFVAIPGTFVSSIDIQEMTSTGNVVACKANLLVQNPAFSQQGGPIPPPQYNLTIFGFFRFDTTGLISSIDVSVPNLGALLDIPAGSPEQAARIGFVCSILTQQSIFSQNPNGTCPSYWAGSNPTARFNSCYGFMSSIAFGSFNRINSNTFVCRLLHALLTPFAPSVHCPHAAPSGGRACIDFSYESYYEVIY